MHHTDVTIEPYQSEKVKSAIAIFCTLEAFQNFGVLVELLLLDGNIYSDDVLPDDTSSTDVQMPAAEPEFVGILDDEMQLLTRLLSYP